MTTEYLLGLDLGTYGSKGVLVDTRGKVVAYHFVEHGVESPKPGWFEQDADEVWWGDLRRLSQALLAQADAAGRSIVAVGVSAVTPNALPVDAAGHALRKAILYSDTRAAEEVQRLLVTLGQDRISQVCGNALSVQSAGPRVLWLQAHEPAVFGRTFKICDATTYLVFKLTGELCADRATACCFHPFFNIHTEQWDADVCAEMGLPMRVFPDLRWSTEVVGAVTRAAASETGLAEGTPVIAGTGDGIAETVSVGALGEGEAALLYGTTMVLLSLTRTLLPHPRVLNLCGPIAGTYLTGAYMSASAALTRWFRDNFGQVEKQVQASLGIDAYHLLSDEAAEVPPGSEGLVVLPYFAGEGYPILDDQARGLIMGLTLSHTRKHVYRALLEGVAYGLRHNWETLREAGVTINHIRAIGGGTKSRVWTQIVSDVLGQDQELVASPYGAPYGDAYLAGLGVGVFQDWTPLRDQWVQSTGWVKSRPAVTRVYDRYFAVYEKLYEPLAESMHTLARLSVSAAC